MIEYSLEELPLPSLICCPQARKAFPADELEGLAQSIREQGLHQPLIAYRSGNEIILIDGERRLRALRMIGATTVLVLVANRKPNTGEVLTMQLTVNCQRASLTPIEKANAIAELMAATQMDAKQVAQRLGLSPPSVTRLLALRLLPPEMQARVASGAIGVSTAYEIAKLADPQDRARLTNQAVRERVTRRQVTRRHAGGPRRSPSAQTQRVVLPLGPGRAVTVKGNDLSVAGIKQCLEELLRQLSNVADDVAVTELRERLSR